jgi:L-threonylcarbamoyladenylate synthase
VANFGIATLKGSLDVDDRGSIADAAARATQRLRPDAAGLDRAAALLKAGELVAFPTETVYGLGADATNARAVAGIFAAKERPSFNPLISHVMDLAAARREGIFDAHALTLAAAFWPGPLTLVLPRTAAGRVCDLARAGLETVALLVPSHALARDLLRRVGVPLAAPSANRSGRVSATAADHVAVDLGGRIAAIVDSGPTTVGIESTIVACIGGAVRLLRPGGLARTDIEAALGAPLEDPDDAERPAAPGMLASHYAPRAPVRLNAAAVGPGEAALLFAQHRPASLSNARVTLNLSERGDLVEAAANLFDFLRRLDAVTPSAIAVSPIPHERLGEAINDRLRRAAAPRPPSA